MERVAHDQRAVRTPPDGRHGGEQDGVDLEPIAALEPTPPDEQRGHHVHRAVAEHERHDGGGLRAAGVDELEPGEDGDGHRGRPVAEPVGQHDHPPLAVQPECPGDDRVQEPERVQHPPYRAEQQGRRNDPHPESDVEDPRREVEDGAVRPGEADHAHSDDRGECGSLQQDAQHWRVEQSLQRRGQRPFRIASAEPRAPPQRGKGGEGDDQHESSADRGEGRGHG